MTSSLSSEHFWPSTDEPRLPGLSDNQAPAIFNGHQVGGGRVYSLSESGGSHALSPHFRLIEFACRSGADLVIVHPALIQMLERIRAEIGAPLTVTSGYRTFAHNKKQGGRRLSRHLFGMAADIYSPRTPLHKVFDAAKRENPGGLGYYPHRGFVHVDVWKESRRWAE